MDPILFDQRFGYVNHYSYFLCSSQLPPDVESVLLQQVLNLTPEQLSSLPPDQQQQVIQLQQALRRDQIQPS